MDRRSEVQDMGSGSVGKLLVRMAVPAVVAQLVNLLYNVVDRIFIGHLENVGAQALTGVGLFTPILMLLTAFALLCGSGGAPRAAIALGKGNRDEAQQIMGNCFSLLLILAVILTVVFYRFAEPMLLLFGASKDTLHFGLQYARVYILGTIFVLITMGMNVFVTAQGFAKISMLSTVIGAVTNILLDYLLIYVFDMGVTGAAVATVVSQGVSALWILCFLTGKHTLIRLKLQDMRLCRNVILPCLGLGVSTFVMVSTESFLSISFTSSLSRYGGDIAVGAMTVMTSINQLVLMPIQGICQGAQPLIGFNYGAGKMERVRRAFFYQFIVCTGYALAFWLCIILIPDVLAGVFTSDAVLVDYTAWALRIFLCAVFSVGFQTSCQQTFVALGEAKISLLLACLRKVILLIPLIFLLPLFFRNKVIAVFIAEPISDIIAATVTTIVFFLRFRNLTRRADK